MREIPFQFRSENPDKSGAAPIYRDGKTVDQSGKMPDLWVGVQVTAYGVCLLLSGFDAVHGPCKVEFPCLPLNGKDWLFLRCQFIKGGADLLNPFWRVAGAVSPPRKRLEGVMRMHLTLNRESGSLNHLPPL